MEGGEIIRIYISISLVLLLLLNGCSIDNSHHEKNDKFIPEGVSSGTEANYNIKLKMDKTDFFSIDTDVAIKNISNEEWDSIVFYFIPNMFTENNSPIYSNKYADVKINDVSIDGKEMDYKLVKDTLSVYLESKLLPKESVTVEIKYTFTLPENGRRFTKDDSNYYLAQWYPMVATYNGGWNKEEYLSYGETYHTNFSNFRVEYEIPKGYSFISTSDNESYPTKNRNTIKVANVKEFFIAIMKDEDMIQKKSDQVNIRVFGNGYKKEDLERLSNIASKAMEYFQNTIGAYPYNQLDIVLGGGLPMEYPGIVTIAPLRDTLPIDIESFERNVVHEIAHQWFYGLVSNDTFKDAWLDEGMTEFATSLFYVDYKNKVFSLDNYSEEKIKEYRLPVNLPIDQYSKDTYSSYIYWKSSSMLVKLFEENGGYEKAQQFLHEYFQTYKYKEVDSKEMVKYLVHFLHLKDDSYFKEWLSFDGK